MMAETVADFLVERLMEWGVSRIYGYPGDGINGITAALLRYDGANDLAVLRAAVEEAAR
jgi:pyruvate dehydrogenase (quinone)